MKDGDHKTWTSDEKYKRYLEREWIVTNGLGGYASSTHLGMNTRKYHGLLVASMDPPVQRRLLLSSLDEEIMVKEETHYLAAHCYPGVVHPEGYRYIEDFSAEPVPSYKYIAGDIRIEKKVFMVHGENTAVVLYSISNPDDTPAIFRVFPLVNNRDIHALTKAGDVRYGQQPTEYGTVLTDGQTRLHLVSDMQYIPQACWYYDLEYDVEISRGYPHREDNLNPGFFEVEVVGDSSFFILASTEDTGRLYIKDIWSLLEREIMRRGKLVEGCASEDTFFRRLIIAGDSFIVNRRSTGSRSVIAGYHWFADWGRDAMIALPGLTLVNRRFDDARDILSTFAANCRQGLIPNLFPDNAGGSPLYNTVDASLWFVHALGRYFDHTGDLVFVNDMWSTVEDILTRYSEGTLFGIAMDKDCLISHGGQLTWMDAKVGDMEITPRKGKACEINALWYNSLRCAERMGEHLGKDTAAYSEIAESAKDSFVKKFWNNERSCLYDTIPGPGDMPEGKDASVRPNQIFAVSLPFTLLPRRMEKSIVDVVRKELLTPYGLRTLSPSDPGYIGTYGGDTLNRDRAYHNGTVWPWLLGAYITAYRKVNEYSEDNRKDMESLLSGLEMHLDEAGTGTVSEVFDGDAPHMPGGCISQAWSVAELARAWAEDIMQKDRPVRNLYET
ncbi:MAG: glycogen debranching enzyme N-terminal domain-containing protein [Methanosarcinaceae archaeon]|nr:glycogen debranching enzyme N-terminal domain-containing protein [Methanosarcinaceae archaeon]